MLHLRDLTTALAGAALILSVNGIAAANSQAQIPARSFVPCVPGKQLTGGVSSAWDDGTVDGFNLALTNRSRACAVMSALWIQLLGKKGGSIGPVVTAPPLSHRVVYRTFQLIDGVSLDWGPICATALNATSVRIGIDGGSLAVRLKSPERVCVHPYFNARLRAPLVPSPSLCTVGEIGIHVGFTQGAAGSLYTTLSFTNVSRSACVVSGFPTVQGSAGTGGSLVGPPARQYIPQGTGMPAIDLNHSGARTIAVYQHPDGQIFGSGYCGPENAPGIDVSVLSYPPTYLSLPVSLCAKVNATSVTHLGTYE